MSYKPPIEGFVPQDSLEVVLAKLAGMDVEVEPNSRLEYILNKIADNMGGGGGGGGGVFACTEEVVEIGGESFYQLNHTFTEIKTAMENGQSVIVVSPFSEGADYGVSHFLITDLVGNTEGGTSKIGGAGFDVNGDKHGVGYQAETGSDYPRRNY